MKWILLIAVAFLLFLVLRYLNRDKVHIADVPFELTPVPQPAQPKMEALPTSDQWSLRAPMSFEEFYAHYYQAANLDKEFVRKVLEYVSKAGGVPSEQIRPEDKLAEFPRKGLQRGIKLVQVFLAPVIANALEKQSGVAVASFELDTVDDVIRHLEPHNGDVFQHLGNAHNE